VIPDDMQTLTGPVLAHRLLLTADASIGGRTTEDVLAKLVATVAIPTPDGHR
jgi:MoxR-like ATPase